MIQKKVLLILSILMMFLSICHAQVGIFDEADTLKYAGQSGVIHVSVDPDSIGLVMVQDSMYDAMLAWDYKNKVLYGYHPDSIVGQKWNPVAAAGVEGAKDTLWISDGLDSFYLKNFLIFTSSQTLFQRTITSNNGKVTIVTNLDFTFLDPVETAKVAVRLMEEPIAKQTFRDSLLAVDFYSAANQSGSFIDVDFDLPTTDIEKKISVIRSGYSASNIYDYTIGLNGSGQRRRITFLIPLNGEFVTVKLIE